MRIVENNQLGKFRQNNMIPKIIHQTWHSIYYDHHNGSPDSWKALNPDWEYMFWLDNDLELFVERNYPEFIKLYQSYPKIVQRTDLGRYLLMHKFGGVYADIDTDCRASLNSIHNENQIILCDVPNKIYPNLKRIFLNLLTDSGYPGIKFEKKVDFTELYKQRTN